MTLSSDFSLGKRRHLNDNYLHLAVYVQHRSTASLELALPRFPSRRQKALAARAELFFAGTTSLATRKDSPSRSTLPAQPSTSLSLFLPLFSFSAPPGILCKNNSSSFLSPVPFSVPASHFLSLPSTRLSLSFCPEEKRSPPSLTELSFHDTRTSSSFSIDQLSRSLCDQPFLEAKSKQGTLLPLFLCSFFFPPLFSVKPFFLVLLRLCLSRRAWESTRKVASPARRMYHVLFS